MSLQEQIERAYKDAFRAGQKSDVLVFRALKSALKNEEIALRVETLSDEQVVPVLRREFKRRREAIKLYEQGQRADLADRERSEVGVIERFLPAELSDEELARLVRAAIEESGASTPADLGKVMAAAKPKVSGRADGGRVSSLVKKLLST